MKVHKRRIALAVIAGLVGLLAISLITAQPNVVRAQETGPNLLANGDFEQDAGQAWPFEQGIPEVQVAPNWHAFWLDNPPSYAVKPDYCKKDTGCYWARPEFRGMSSAEFANRVHGGSLSQKYFTFNRQHEAGMYQQVSGIQPGSRLRFQVYMQTWSCTAGDEWNICPTSPLSNKPAPMHTKVGIDPTGGTNAWAGTVVWSQEFESYDQWTAFWVEATAEAGTVTVFTYSRADWSDTWPRLNNDVYVDDASLTVVGDAEPTAAPPPPTPAVPPTPAATSTPRPDGAVVHVVQSGDTLFGIAIQYGIDSDELRRLNAGTLGPNDLLSVGQELVISGAPINAPTPTPVPTEAQPVTEPTVATVTTEPGATAEVGETASGAASLCVLVYHDRDNDMVRQEASEELLPNAALTLVGTGGPAGTYTTDGISEPYCFQGLQPGNYVLRQTAPTGYSPSGPAEWGILLGEGQTYSLQIGCTSDGSVATGELPNDDNPEQLPASEEGTEGAEESTGLTSKLLNIVIRVSGVVALLLAIVVAVLFFLSRRKTL